MDSRQSAINSKRQQLRGGAGAGLTSPGVGYPGSRAQSAGAGRAARGGRVGWRLGRSRSPLQIKGLITAHPAGVLGCLTLIPRQLPARKTHNCCLLELEGSLGTICPAPPPPRPPPPPPQQEARPQPHSSSQAGGSRA